MEAASDLIQAIYYCDAEFVAIEQPKMSPYARDCLGIPPTQTVHPHQHGHGESKAVLLWTRNLPEIRPLCDVSGRWKRLASLSPSPHRAAWRSETLPGIAAAMAATYAPALHRFMQSPKGHSEWNRRPWGVYESVARAQRAQADRLAGNGQPAPETTVASLIPYRPTRMRYRAGSWHVFDAAQAKVDLEDPSGSGFIWRNLGTQPSRQVDMAIDGARGNHLALSNRRTEPTRWKGSRVGAAIAIQTAQRGRRRREVTRWARHLAHQWQHQSARRIQRAFRRQSWPEEAESTGLYLAMVDRSGETGEEAHTSNGQAMVMGRRSVGTSSVCIVPENVQVAPLVQGAQSAYLHEVGIVRGQPLPLNRRGHGWRRKSWG